MSSVNFYILADLRKSDSIYQGESRLDSYTFFSTNYKDEMLVAIFLSKLDAEVCMNYQNDQMHNGAFNNYDVLECRDLRIGSTLRQLCSNYAIVAGFHADVSSNLIMFKQEISMACIYFSETEMNLLLWPDELLNVPHPKAADEAFFNSIFHSVKSIFIRHKPFKSKFELVVKFLSQFDYDYWSELKGINELSSQNIKALANTFKSKNRFAIGGRFEKLSVYSIQKSEWLFLTYIL